jgi:FKBP-type peptidyl-prolyl cis-trans isomerase (trigger factor)
MTKIYEHITINNLPAREVEISGEITKETIESLRKEALAKLKESVIVDGFRKGQAPDNLVVSKVGDVAILEEAGELALQKAYPQILEEYKLDAIGKPQITITKIGVGSALGFSIKTALMPEVTLGDYKKIAKKVLGKEDAPTPATDEDVEKAIEHIRKSVAHQKLHEKEGLDEHTHTHGDIQDEDLPEVNLEFVQSLGNFASVEDFKTKIKENITKENEFKHKDKRRTDILEEIISASTIELPRIIVDGEIEKMKAQLEDDLKRSGITLEQYLEYIKKTEEDIRKDWEPTAVKRAQSQIILNTIAREEGIAPEEEQVKKEMGTILSQYKDAERFRVRMYVETFLTNELVFSFLEGLEK